MPTAIIGVGNIGKAVASHLTEAGEPVVLVAQTRSSAERVAEKLAQPASAAGEAEAIDEADAVIFAVWFEVLKELVERTQIASTARW